VGPSSGRVGRSAGRPDVASLWVRPLPTATRCQSRPHPSPPPARWATGSLSRQLPRRTFHVSLTMVNRVPQKCFLTRCGWWPTPETHRDGVQRPSCSNERRGGPSEWPWRRRPDRTVVPRFPSRQTWTTRRRTAGSPSNCSSASFTMAGPGSTARIRHPRSRGDRVACPVPHPISSTVPTFSKWTTGSRRSHRASGYPGRN
jgi:hypothetical protein